MMLTVFALAFTVLSCACLYLASPNQKLLKYAPSIRPLLVVGCPLLAAAGLALWIVALRPLSGLFVALHVAMVCLFAFPYIAAWRTTRRP